MRLVKQMNTRTFIYLNIPAVFNTDFMAKYPGAVLFDGGVALRWAIL